MSKEVKAPFHADHVGSLLRPARLKKAREDFQAGNITNTELRQIEDEEIKRIVDKQVEIGINNVTDGEFRRSWWHLDFWWGLDGVEKADSGKGLPFKGIETRAETARITGKIDYSDHPFIEDFKYLSSIVPEGVTARQTFPSAAQFLLESMRPYNIEHTKKHYPNKQDLYDDVVNVYKKVFHAFYDLGCRYIQMDETVWAALSDTEKRKQAIKEGIDVDQRIKEYVEVNNRILEGLPEDLVVGSHVCRGNYRSRWHFSGGYEPVAEEVFGKEKINNFYLEFDTDRAGGFEPLQHLSEDKTVVLGLITSKEPELEDENEVIKRIHEAAEYVPLERLSLSPQCGFSPTEEGNELTEEDQWNKLRLIKRISEQVWGK